MQFLVLFWYKMGHFCVLPCFSFILGQENTRNSAKSYLRFSDQLLEEVVRLKLLLLLLVGQHPGDLEVQPRHLVPVVPVVMVRRRRVVVRGRRMVHGGAVLKRRHPVVGVLVLRRGGRGEHPPEGVHDREAHTQNESLKTSWEVLRDLERRVDLPEPAFPFFRGSIQDVAAAWLIWPARAGRKQAKKGCGL